MSYVEEPFDKWQKQLLDSLARMEGKLDRLLVLREQTIDTAGIARTDDRHYCLPTAEGRIPGHYRRLQTPEGGAENDLQLGFGREDSLSQGQRSAAVPAGGDR